MTHAESDAQEAAASLLTQLELPAADPQEVLAQLENALNRLLAETPERLAQLCYRLDIPEPAFHAALRQPSKDAIVQELATLFLEREKKRLYWRRRYSDDTPPTPPPPAH